MKKLLLSFGCFVTSVTPVLASATNATNGLQPESCTIGGTIGVVKPLVTPLTEVGFYFNSGITLSENAKAEVTCEDKTVATATSLEASNYSTSNCTQGALTIYFDEQLLPKGKTYTLRVAPGSVALDGDASVVNLEFEQSFSIPEDLGAASFDSEKGCVITTASSSVYESLPACYWGYEVSPAENAHYILYREGVHVREIPADVSSDWDLGCSQPAPEDKIYFENGVNYTLVLPAGSVRAYGREDIVNREEVFQFVGGYTEPLPSLNYVWCSLFTNHSDVLNVVSFKYDRPVRLSENAVMQLWYGDGSEMIMEVPMMYVEPETEEWLLCGDFGGYQMDSDKGYSIVIPEGAVIALDGNPVVNKRYVIDVNSSTGVENALINENDTPKQLYDLTGRKVYTPAPGQIYIMNGKKILIK